MFRFKSFIEWLSQVKEIDEAGYGEKDPKEMAELNKEYWKFINDGVEEMLKSKIDADTVKDMIKDLVATGDLQEYVKESQIEDLKKLAEDARDKANQAIDKTGPKGQETLSIKEQIVKQVNERKDEWDKLKEDKKASFSVEIAFKAPGSMVTGTNLTPAGNRIQRNETEPGSVGVLRRSPFVADYVTVSTTNSKLLYWVERVNHDGTVGMTAEGAVKSQVDWDYVESNVEVKKQTAFIKHSKEMLDDVDGFAQDVEDELTEQMLLNEDGQILTGDGAGNNIVGLDANATAFAAGAFANTIEGANNFDVLRVALNQVVLNKDMAIAIFVHPNQATEMDLVKATDGQYVLPPFVAANGVTIKGVPVIENLGVADDDFYVGNFRRYKFKRRETMTITYGYDSDDWTKNMITPLAETRYAGYIPANHYGSIIKGDFTTAKAALETP